MQQSQQSLDWQEPTYPHAIKKKVQGDWNCGKCNNLNYSFRTICNRCQSYQEDTKGFNSAVFMIQNPIDADDISTQNSTPITYDLEDLPEIDSLLAEVALKLQLQNQKVSNSVSTSPRNDTEKQNDSNNRYNYRKKTKRPPLSREGDWMCSQCGNINFAFRKQCNVCIMPQIILTQAYDRN